MHFPVILLSTEYINQYSLRPILFVTKMDVSRHISMIDTFVELTSSMCRMGVAFFSQGAGGGEEETHRD
jgi:hypothetical protein